MGGALHEKSANQPQSLSAAVITWSSTQPPGGKKQRKGSFQHLPHAQWLLPVHKYYKPDKTKTGKETRRGKKKTKMATFQLQVLLSGS